MHTYDESNQLVTSTVNGVTTHYKYDAAGRMIQAGDKSYIYNGQNKVVEVRQNGKTIDWFDVFKRLCTKQRLIYFFRRHLAGGEEGG